MTTDWFTASPTPLGPPGVESLVGGDDAGDQTEGQRLDLAGPEVLDLGQRTERGQVGTGGPALEDDVEEVAARDADHADQPVEQDRDQHRGEHPRDDEALDRADAQHLHRVDLVADLAGPEVGADSRTARAGDEQRGDDRAGLAEDGEHRGRPGERLGTELAGQRAQLQGDDRAERDGDQRRRQDRHTGDEPGLLDELADLERPLGQRPDHVQGECEEVPAGRERARGREPAVEQAGGLRLVGRRHPSPPCRGSVAVGARPAASGSGAQWRPPEPVVAVKRAGVGPGEEVLGQRGPDRLLRLLVELVQHAGDPLLAAALGLALGQALGGGQLRRDGVPTAGALGSDAVVRVAAAGLQRGHLGLDLGDVLLLAHPDRPLAAAVEELADHRLLRGQQLLARAEHHQVAAEQQAEVVGDRPRRPDVVGDDQERGVDLRVEVDDQLVEVGHAHGVEAGVGLVEQDDLGVEHQGAREAGALAHPAGDLAGELPLGPLEADHLHLLEDDRPDLAPRTSWCARAAGTRCCRRGSSSRTGRRPGTARRTASGSRRACARWSSRGRRR